MSRKSLLVAVPLIAVLAFSFAQAQDAGGRHKARGGAKAGEAAPAGDQAGRAGQGRERWMMNTVKEQMGATDDEWKALSPKIEKILKLSHETRPMPGGGFGRGRAPEAQPESDVGKAQADLRKAVEDKSASADDLAKKLTTYREARDKVKTELQTLQKELKAEVKGRQEAVLVINGILN